MAAPKGNNNAARGKGWREAVECALKAYEDNDIQRGAALKAIGKKLISMALDGDMQAIKEIGDRLDGKAVQAVDANINHSSNVDELTDAVLSRIATSSSAGASKEKGGTEELNSIH